MKVLYRVEAAADLEEARAWYENQRPGLAALFGHALLAVEGLVKLMPEAFPLVAGDVRRALLPKFPYVMYYRLRDSDTIEVLACLHNRRDPRRWRSRIDT